MKRILGALLIVTMHLPSSAYAGKIEIAASIVTDKTLACQSADDFMQILGHLQSNDMQALLNDRIIYTGIGRCIDLDKGQGVFIESEPRGDLLCVRPVDGSVCYWAYTSNVAPR